MASKIYELKKLLEAKQFHTGNDTEDTVLLLKKSLNTLLKDFEASIMDVNNGKEDGLVFYISTSSLNRVEQGSNKMVARFYGNSIIPRVDFILNACADDCLYELSFVTDEPNADNNVSPRKFYLQPDGRWSTISLPEMIEGQKEFDYVSSEDIQEEVMALWRKGIPKTNSQAFGGVYNVSGDTAG